MAIYVRVSLLHVFDQITRFCFTSMYYHCKTRTFLNKLFEKVTSSSESPLLKPDMWWCIELPILFLVYYFQEVGWDFVVIVTYTHDNTTANL